MTHKGWLKPILEKAAADQKDVPAWQRGEASEDAERREFEQLAVEILNTWSVPCGVSIEEHGDRLIYGSRYMDAMRELYDKWLVRSRR